ncbi:MAG: DUF4097 domain-containing protein [Bacilli bacterium]|nr:DUF4097 domain-containing protein [Bacilli bacterium]
MNSGQKAIKITAICLAVFIIVNIINAVLMGISFIGGFSPSFSKGLDFVESYTNISSIKLDLNASKVNVLVGSELKVEATNVSKSFSSKVVNGNILKIEEHQSWFWHHQNGEITITVPQNISLEELDIDCGAGKIEVSNITARKLDIDAGAGLLKIDHSNFQETDIDGGAGEINITSSILNNLDLDAGVGKVSIDGDIYGNSEIDCGVGEVNLNLGSDQNYQLTIQKGLGSINVNNVSYSHDVTLGTGDNRLKIEGGIGAININWYESNRFE